MENNSQKAIGFIFILFLTMTYKDMVWDPYFLPSTKSSSQTATASNCPPCEGSKQVPVATSAAATTLQPQQTTATGASLTTPSKSAYPTDSQITSAGLITLTSKEATAQISKLGGRISEYRLVRYAESLAKDSPQLNLVEHSETNPLPLGVYSGPVNDTWVEYRVESQTPASVLLTGTLPDGRTIKKNIGFSQQEYLLAVSVELSAPPANGAKLELEWSRLIPQDSEKFLDSQSTGGFVWFDGQRAQRETYNAMSTAERSFGRVRWLSTTDHYFVASLISQLPEGDARAFHEGDLFKIRLSGAPAGGEFLVLGGPKSYRILGGLGHALERNIDFGWTGFLSAPLLTLLHMFYAVFKNYGLAIVALTILVRLLLLPLNAASFRSMKAMQDLQPDVQRLKETMKDKQQQQMALMALYKQKGVNPLGGCLPIVVQIPIFFGLYSALLMAVELRHAKWALWIADLSAPEKLMLGGIGIPVLVILFVASMLYQQWSTPSTMDETQKKIMLVMPVVFGFVFFIHMPAGLTLYWLTSNVISIAQMHQLRKEGKHSAILVTTAVAAATLALAWVLTLVG
jgi:YidC/Oxa1 family membrane protein insertase